MQAPITLSWLDKFKRSVTVVFKSLSFLWNHKKLLFFPFFTASLVVASIGVYELTYYALYQKHITSFFPEPKSAQCRRLHQEAQSRLQAAQEQLRDQPRDQKTASEQLEAEQALLDNYAQEIEENYQEIESKSCDPEDDYTFGYLLFAWIITFIAIFFSALSNTALSHATTQGFNNAPISITASLKHSFSRFFTLLVWSISALAIHFLVNIFRKKDNRGRSSFLGRFIGEAIEFAWYIATFLVIPVMAHEQLGGIKSIKRSAHLMKEKFGENLISALALNYFFGIFFFLLLAVMLCTTWLVAKFGTPALSAAILAPLFIICITLFLLLIPISSATTTIFKTAVYHYVTNNPMGPFGEQELQASFVPEHKSQS
jgi:hypothetical protein